MTAALREGIRQLARPSGEDAAGDGAGFFPHLRSVPFGDYVSQIHGGVVEDGGEARGWLRLVRQ
jgi:hypothetical protein